MICGREDMKTHFWGGGGDALGCWFAFFIIIYTVVGRYPTLLFFLLLLLYCCFPSRSSSSLFGLAGLSVIWVDIVRLAKKVLLVSERVGVLYCSCYCTYRSKDGGGGGELCGMISQVEEMDDLMMLQKPI